MTQRKTKILIIQTAFIGDVILATALIESILAQNSLVEIHFLLRKGNESLLSEDNRISKVWVWDKRKKWKNFFRLIRQIRKEDYAATVCVQRFFMAGMFTLFSNSNKTFGFSKNPLSIFFNKKYEHSIGDGSHEIERNLLLLSSFSNVKLENPKLILGENNISRILKYTDETYITISPASVWFTKQFPKEKWILFLNRVKGHKVYVLGGPGDLEICQFIKEGSTNNNVEVLSGKLSLLQSAALMQKAVMNYVNDSAPLHLCSATNAPVTAIFCSTTPKFGFTPLSTRNYVVEHAGKLECKPCGLHGKMKCPLDHYSCGNIDITRLIEIIED